ncbi:MAG: vWA domain-containing protein, partial [Filifactoraceae bacterium]
MRKNRLIALVTILTMIITSGLGNLGLLLSSYAQDKSNLIIADIFNEEPIPTPDNKLLLDQNIEKVSDTELKINLNIKSLSESIDLKNVILVNTLSDNLEINSDSVSVIGIENEKDAKGEVTQPRDTVTVELGDVSSGEVNVSFLAKIRQSATAGENISLNLKVELKYSLDTEEEGVYNFAIPKFNLIENVVEEEVKEEDLSVGEEAVMDDESALPEVSSQSTVVNPTPELNPGTVTKPSLETHKKAEDNGDGTFKITLEVKGKPTVVEPKKADIVMVIDKSGSMSDKISEVKDAATAFSDNILSSNPNNQVNISVVTFNSIGDRPSSEGIHSEIIQPFTDNRQDVNKAINAIIPGGGTHTQEGILRTVQALDTARTDSNKYVVFFTDGLPMESYSNFGPGDDKAFKEAQADYYKYFTGYNSPTEVIIGGIGYNPIPETIHPSIDTKYKDVKFYTLGLFTEPKVIPGDPPMTDEEKEQLRNNAIQFMSSIQNVIARDNFASKYYTENLNEITDIFWDISNEIKGDINITLSKDLLIHDIVTKEFKIKDKSWELTDLKGNSITIPDGSVIVNETADKCTEITIRVGDLIANQVDASGNLIGGVRFSFDVETTDPYFSGDNIKTNVGADINYKDPTTNSESSEAFKEDPTVNISPKKGKIKVTKNVKNTLGQ